MGFSVDVNGVWQSVELQSTGWGKITSLNFKVNNKKTIQDTTILFLDSETTTWEVLNHIVLKRISCKWWPLLSIHCCRRILIFRITLSSISCGMRATSRRIASFSACRVLGRCLNTSAFRYPTRNNRRELNLVSARATKCCLSGRSVGRGTSHSKQPLTFELCGPWPHPAGTRQVLHLIPQELAQKTLGSWRHTAQNSR